MASTARITQAFVEALTRGNGPARVTQGFLEALTRGNGPARITQTFLEVLTPADSKARVTQVFLEVLCPGGTVINGSAPNTLTLTQNVAVAVSYNKPASNTLTFSQAAGLGTFENVNHTLTLTQTAFGRPGYNRSASNTLALTQRANLSRSFSVSHTLTLTNLALRVIDASANHTLSFTQDPARLKLKRVVASNNLVLTQTLTPALEVERTVNQGLLFSQAVARNLTRVLSRSQTLTLTQTVTYTATKLASNSLTFSQTATATVGKRTSNALVLTQIGSRIIYRNLTGRNNFIPFQVLAVNKTYRRALSQTLTLTQTAVGLAVKSTSNALALTQTVSAESSKSLSDFAPLEDGVSFTRSFTMPVDQLLSLDSGCLVTVVKQVSATTIVAFDQFAKQTRRYTKSASNTLSLSQDLVATRYIRSISQSLNFTQTASGLRVLTRSANNSLNLLQSVQLSKDIVRSASNTLIFRSSRRQDIGLGSSGGEVDIPNTIGVRVKNLVILKSGSAIITLPAPQFNDVEAGTSKVNIKRAMNGARRVYKRESLTSRLSYAFVIDRKKAIELRTFILNNNSKVLDLENWKGEVWKVLLTNNPFQFTEEGLWKSPWGNRSAITLEFEGAKIN